MGEDVPVVNEAVDLDGICEVLAEHPVRLAVIFGSTVRGERHPHSDIDLAVEFEEDAPDTLDTRLSLFADLSTRLDRNDIDIAIVDELDPRVGKRAFSEGVLVLGSEKRFERYRTAFEHVVDREVRESPAERFDAVIDRLDRVIDG